MKCAPCSYDETGTPQSGFVEVDSPTGLIELLVAGVGVSLVSQTWVHREKLAGLISVAQIAPAPLRRQLALVWASVRRVSPPQQQLADMISRFVSDRSQELGRELAEEPVDRRSPKLGK